MKMVFEIELNMEEYDPDNYLFFEVIKMLNEKRISYSIELKDERVIE